MLTPFLVIFYEELSQRSFPSVAEPHAAEVQPIDGGSYFHAADR